jgi:hypothetical protein
MEVDPFGPIETTEKPHQIPESAADTPHRRGGKHTPAASPQPNRYRVRRASSLDRPRDDYR